MHKEVSIEDIERIDSLVHRLCNLKFETERLKQGVLDGVLELVPALGTCSFLRLDRFFSELDKDGNKGKVIEPAIHKRPPHKIILKKWEDLTYNSMSDIEAAIYKKRDSDRFGVARRRDVLSEASWKTSALFFIAKLAGVKDLAYLWIRCSESDLWILCLRKSRRERDFSDYEMAILREFGEQFYRRKMEWYLEKLPSFNFNEQEHKTLTLLEEGNTPVEIANILGVKTHTVRGYVKSIHKKTGTNTNAKALKKIKDSI